MKINRVTVTCLGDCGSNSFDINPAQSPEWIDTHCGLLDGSSPHYQYDPRDDPNITIGKCGMCGGPIRATHETIDAS